MLPAVVGAAAAVNDTVRADVSAASNVVFHVKNTGTATMSVGTFVFEASLDSTNGTWHDGARVSTPVPVRVGAPIKVGATTFELRK